MADCFLMKSGIKEISTFVFGENIFNYEEFKNAIGNNIASGTIEWNDENQSFTLIATGNDCYTQHNYSPAYYLDSTQMYELSFDADNLETGRILVLYNGNTSTMLDFGTQRMTKIIFSSFISSTYVWLRFGVRIAGEKCTYSNIKLRPVLSF